MNSPFFCGGGFETAGAQPCVGDEGAGWQHFYDGHPPVAFSAFHGLASLPAKENDNGAVGKKAEHDGR